MNDKKNLQCSPTGSYYIYFSKSVIEKAYHWHHMQKMEIQYDAPKKRIIISAVEE
jgi:hypothetical protein